MMRLQTDELSIPARQLVPLLEEIEVDDAHTERAEKLLLGWDHVLDKRSVAAGVYVAWEAELRRSVNAALVPTGARVFLSLKKTIVWS